MKVRCFNLGRKKAGSPSIWRKDSGSGVLLIIGLLGVLSVLAAMAVPDLIRKIALQHADQEEMMMRRLVDGLRASIEHAQEIPGTNKWVEAVAAQAGLDPEQVRKVFPGFPDDTTTERRLLIDPGFTPATTPALLPYVQEAEGLEEAGINAPGLNTRLMIVSSSRRGLALPYPDGAVTSQAFSNLWNWNLDPATGSAPAGFPSPWNGQGRHLHVGRLNLANAFHSISMENLSYVLNGEAGLTVSNSVERIFLHGSLLELSDLSGELKQIRVVNKDDAFSFPPPDTGGGGDDDEEEEEETGTVYYLTASGEPRADLSVSAPTATTLQNYDPGRDAFPGLLLAKGGKGPKENDSTQFQVWFFGAGGFSINGPVTFTMYSAMKDFNTSKRGSVRVYLVECNPTGRGCSAIGPSSGVTLSRSDWDADNTGTWIEDTIDFGAVAHSFSSGKRLGVLIVVDDSSGDDMWFAYWTATYDSRLVVGEN